jgi:hypothetical protein
LAGDHLDRSSNRWCSGRHFGIIDGCGVEESDAHLYAEGIRRGSALVIARVDASQADAAQSILGQSFDAAALRREFEADGWSGFNDSDPWDEDAPDQ